MTQSLRVPVNSYARCGWLGGEEETAGGFQDHNNPHGSPTRAEHSHKTGIVNPSRLLLGCSEVPIK